MAKEVNQDNSNSILIELATKIRDLEEKQRRIKDKLVLMGENLLEVKETQENQILEIKKQMEVFRNAIEKMTSFLEMASNEFSKFAKKEDLEILTKQAKMFQPLI